MFPRPGRHPFFLRNSFAALSGALFSFSFLFLGRTRLRWMKCLTTLSIFINVATRGQATIVCLSVWEGPLAILASLPASLVSHLFWALSRWRRVVDLLPSTSSRGGNQKKKWNLFKRIKNWKSHKHAFATSLGTAGRSPPLPSLPLGLPLNRTPFFWVACSQGVKAMKNGNVVVNTL